jgi:quinol monooxygenase YgiN
VLLTCETCVFLYEVYDDEAAFEAHTESQHYARFAAARSSRPLWFERPDPLTHRARRLVEEALSESV